jgi:hypothetical protein
MTTRTINFVNDFTDCPGGRYRSYGPFSGEQFREEILKPALLENDRVILNMDGVLGFPASFLDEAFGILVEELGPEVVAKKLTVNLTDNRVARSEIDDCIASHQPA